MEQPQMPVREEPNSAPAESEGDPPVARSAAGAGTMSPQGCPTCGTAPATNGAIATDPPCIYVIGHIEPPRYPLLSIEKEARQVMARGGASKDTDREVMAKLLRDPANKYLVRQLCWILSVQGVETYILMPRDGDYQPLIDAYRAEPNPGDLELVIGIRGPIARPEMCNGLMVPVVIFDQIYPFDRESLLSSIKPDGDQKFRRAAAEVFDRITSQIDNAGATDADRALNYLSVRYDRIYTLAAEQLNNNAALTAINVLPSPLSGTRKIVDVVFSFTDRASDVVSKYFTRVDVTDCLPFLCSKMAPYYDR